MTQLIQITDTHILPAGEVLYGSIDTAAHLRETVRSINRMQSQPDVALITGDLVERGDMVSYQHFMELISPLEMPVYVIPGNHDDPQIMLESFAGTACFPASGDTFQYVINDLPFRILALNSHCAGTELPAFDQQRLSWLENQLGQSDKPVLIALHHPPMVTGVELIDMGGLEWFQQLGSVLAKSKQVRLVICGHCHTDLVGRIGHAVVYMAGAISHQLIATRGLSIAPSSVNAPSPPTLHHFINGEFLSGSNPWPADVEDKRIDKVSGISWDELKDSMKETRL
jgi:Icc protein